MKLQDLRPLRQLKRLTAAILSAAVFFTGTMSAGAQDLQVTAKRDDAPLPYGLAGMPANYTLKSGEASYKARVRATTGILSSLTPGVDYVSGQILYFADSEEEAETVAAAYNADLFQFQYGVATASLRGGITVAQAVAVGADPRYALPAVTPNYITKFDETAGAVYTDEVTYTETDAPDAPESDAAAAKSGQQEWADALGDPALRTAYMFESKNAAAPDKTGIQVSGYQWMHDAIGTYEAWNTTMGSDKITVAVIDTGVDDLHEDLAGHCVNLTDVVDLSYQKQKLDENGNVIYDDNGNIVYETVVPDALDGTGHGTHVAGIIASTAGNGIGGAGVAPGVNIIGLPVFIDIYDGNYCLTDAQISAVRYVAGYNKDGTKGSPRANIINISIGSPSYSEAYQRAVNDAYEAGVTVCVSIGNFSTNSVSYPAGYDHVIAVCATDRDNSRASFSNYGPWADIAAPGVEIFSTWNGHSRDSETKEYYTQDRHNWYGSWDGTSMASPVVAGACALYMSAVGAVDPDTMEAVLKKTAIKLSDKGLGAGLVNVAAMMPDSAASSALNAPVFFKEAGETRTEVKSSVTLEDGEKLIIDVPAGAASSFAVASFDGSEPSVKNGTAGKNCFIIPIDEPFRPDEYTTARSYTLKAAYVSTKGTLGRTASLSVKVNAEYEHIIDISGPACAASGKSVKYAAYINSAPVNVTWGVEGAPAGTTIDAKGTLKVAKNAAAGTEFKVTAVSASDSGVTGEFTVCVTSPVTSITVGFEEGALKDEINAPVKDKKGIFKSIRLYNADIERTADFTENEAAVKITMTGLPAGKDACFTCVSSKPGVAVFKDGSIIAVGEGKTKLTFTAADGSGKKAAIDVIVIVPASSLLLTQKDNQKYVAFGKTAQVNAVTGTTYGTPTVKAMSWEITGNYQYIDENDSKNTISVSATDDIINNKFVTVDKNGKVSVNKKLEPFMYNKPAIEQDGSTFMVYELIITVTAATTDGTGLTASTQLAVTAPTQALYLIWPDSTAYAVATGNTFYISMPVGQDGMAYSYTELNFKVNAVGSWYRVSSDLYSYSSSDPKCGSIICTGSDANGYMQFTVVISKPGRAKITVKANDGSGKKLDLNIYSYGFYVQ